MQETLPVEFLKNGSELRRTARIPPTVARSFIWNAETSGLGQTKLLYASGQGWFKRADPAPRVTARAMLRTIGILGSYQEKVCVYATNTLVLFGRCLPKKTRNAVT